MKKRLKSIGIGLFFLLFLAPVPIKADQESVSIPLEISIQTQDDRTIEQVSGEVLIEPMDGAPSPQINGQMIRKAGFYGIGKVDLGSIDLTEPGEYRYKISIELRKGKDHVKVIDPSFLLRIDVDRKEEGLVYTMIAYSEQDPQAKKDDLSFLLKQEPLNKTPTAANTNENAWFLLLTGSILLFLFLSYKHQVNA